MEHLIPLAPFVPMPQVMLLLIAAAAVYFLITGADGLVEGASGLAYRLGMSKVIVGATIVSLGTTSPEAAVSVMAAWQHQPGLALGNAVGSIIADTGLIFGLGCMLAVLPADRFVLSRQGWVQFGCATLLALVCYGLYIVQGDGATLYRTVGIVFLALLAAYMVMSVKWSKAHPQSEPFQTPDDMARSMPVTPESAAQAEHEAVGKLLSRLVVGLALVVVASQFLINSVTVLAEDHWHVPKVVVAATLVALGTSLPELAVGIASIVKGHKELLVGNVIGADILNVLFVIGASAVAEPLPIVEQGSSNPHIMLTLHLPAMILILALFRFFIFKATKTGQFRRWNGAPLVGIYVAFVVLTYVLS